VSAVQRDRHVYLDHNATAPLHRAARDAMVAAFDLTGNPSSVHRFGRDARRMVEGARRSVADLLAVDPVRVVFTAGATEALNHVVRGLGRPVLVSAIEHDAVRAVAGERPDTRIIPVDGDGVVDVAALERLLSADPRPTLVVVMAVNNETGVIQPMAAVRAVAARHGALVLCDAVQAAGRLPLNDLGDVVVVSAHKIGGPAGVGAICVPEGLAMAPLIVGGGQEKRRRAGTENIVGIAGFGAAATVAATPLDLSPLRDGTEAALRRADPGLLVFGARASRIGNTTSIAMPGVSSETQVMAFDLAGIAVGAGAACSSGKVAASHVLRAMGVADDLAGSAVRVSFGPGNTAADADRFVGAWTDLRRRTTGRAA
jgi:cysteine desulfurase